MASTKLTRTPASNGNSKTWTWSAWVKLSEADTEYVLFHNFGATTNDEVYAKIGGSSGTIEFALRYGGTYEGRLITNRQFRDLNGWYNLVFVCDTPNATAGDRQRIYVNGVEETSFSTDTQIAQDAGTVYNQTYEHTIGSYGSGNYFNGSMSHINAVDGTAYDASYFGSTNSTTGQWEINTSPTVTYGTNGYFILKDSNSVTDQSGNANNWTVASGSLTNTEDNPSNVFATLNGLADINANSTLTNGGLTHTDTGGSWLGEYTTLGAFTGKFYAEGKITDRMNYSFGVIQSGGDSVANISTANNNLIGRWNDGWGFNGNNGTTNKKYHNNSTTDPYGEVFADNDIFMIAVDVTGGKIYFGRNGTWFDSGNPADGTNPAFTGETFTDSVHFASGMENGSLTWNFGNGYFGTTAISSEGTNASGLGKFEYDVPSGYTALCTKGLNL